MIGSGSVTLNNAGKPVAKGVALNGVPFGMLAIAKAPEPVPGNVSLIVTVGAEVYPEPGFVNVTAVTLTVALAFAPVPPPPVMETIGAL